MIIKEPYTGPGPGPWKIHTSTSGQVLDFGTQGPTPTLWLNEPDMDNRIIERTFAVAWTGQDAPGSGRNFWWRPLGSAIAEHGIVWHCFERIEAFE